MRVFASNFEQVKGDAGRKLGEERVKRRKKRGKRKSIFFNFETKEAGVYKRRTCDANYKKNER